MIAIVDYRAGNLTSVQRALDALGLAESAHVTQSPADIAAADRIIFPGVGAAGEAMDNLRDLGLAGPLRQAVADGKPFLGICIGYQLLFERSEEDSAECLGLFAGRVVRFAAGLREAGSPRPLKIPQMGWNEVRFRGHHPLWEGVPAGSEFYFVHSYYPEPSPDRVCATAVYGIEFAAGAARNNLVGFQFHPEKSGRPGLRLLANFCAWRPC
ncbi:MAG: Imidazole glycerol phosphate synthase subunit HisH 1 [Lentisphaerae bacterium ADurb.BinA184]|nr:MAG: Imidazole glycerol phosphate synthase subunit HisH 1 [Lentisphaerae bacterium ADurb.BinA184]